MRSSHPLRGHVRSRFTSPGRLIVGVLLAAALTTAGCSATGSSADESGSGGSGSFTFTDDRGEEVSLDKDPSELRIVAQEDAAQALMHLGIKPVGVFGGTAMDKNPTLEGLDLDGVESVGESWGQIKMEKLAMLHPDLIVSTIYTGDGALFDGGVYGFGTEKQQDDAAKIAPIVAIKATQPSSKVIERFTDLAGALGADVDSGDVAESRKAFETAVADLKKAAADSKASVLAVTPATDAYYVAVPDAFADTQDLVAWGVDMMKPTGKLVSSYYEALSWENAATYQPDIILIDRRGYTLSSDDLGEQYPTWNDIGAVKADSVGSWMRISLNYDDYTEQVRELTALLEKASAS